MKAQFEKVGFPPERSVLILQVCKDAFDAPLHFHPEWELTWIQHGEGKRFVGECVEAYGPGDLVLLGPNMPHFWHSQSTQSPQLQDSKSGGGARAVVAQFAEDFPGREFLMLPESRGIGELLAEGRQGVHFTGGVAAQAAARMAELPRLKPFEVLLELLKILSLLGTSARRTLVRTGQVRRMDAKSGDRLGRVYTFLLNHFRDPLTLGQIAKVAAMTPTSFSRFFKKTTGRGVWEFLNELRLEQAVKGIREGRSGTTQIALESGFATLSSFHRQFRRRHGCNPGEYRRVVQAMGEGWEGTGAGVIGGVD